MHQGTLPREQGLARPGVAKEGGKDLRRRRRWTPASRAQSIRWSTSRFAPASTSSTTARVESGFSYYVRTRLAVTRSGASRQPDAAPRNIWAATSRVSGLLPKRAGHAESRARQSFLTGPAELHRPGVRAARHRQPQGGPGKARTWPTAFCARVAPGTIEHWLHNEHYRVRRRLPLRHRRRHARGVQGDHRRRPHPADRRPGPAGRLADVPGDERRRSTASTPTCASRR